MKVSSPQPASAPVPQRPVVKQDEEKVAEKKPAVVEKSRVAIEPAKEKPVESRAEPNNSPANGINLTV